MRALAFLLAAALPLSACGLQPMYAGGGSGRLVKSDLGTLILTARSKAVRDGSCAMR